MNRYKQIHKKTKDLSLLLVEDHESTRQKLEEVLNGYFLTVVSCEDGEEALDAYTNYYNTNQCYFDIVLSDIEMPKMNGVKLSKALKDINKEQKIIILSAHQDGHYLVPLINIGANKFIEKPIDYDILLEMFETLSEDRVLVEQKTLNLGDNYIWDFEHSLVMRDEDVVHMTSLEITILKILIDSGKYICKTEHITSIVYGSDTKINYENLKNVISRMRKKLPIQLIETVYGSGYRLILP